MRAFKILGCIAICSSIVSCKTLAQKKTDNVNISPASAVPKCSTEGDNPIDFILMNDVVITKPQSKKGRQLPKKYTVYKIDNTQLQHFFQKVKENGTGTINLPVPSNGCKQFKLELSDVLSKELAAKHAELISLKGESPESPSNTARVDYDGKKLNVQIVWENEVFYLTPWEEKGKLWYLLSDKKDTGYEKVPYE